MIKEKNNYNWFEFIKDGNKYEVLIKNLKNTEKGCPRYEAIILNYIEGTNKVYNFTGHYRSNRDEAEIILDHMLKQEEEWVHHNL